MLHVAQPRTTPQQNVVNNFCIPLLPNFYAIVKNLLSVTLGGLYKGP